MVQYNGKKYTRNKATGVWYDADNMKVPVALQQKLNELYKKEQEAEEERIAATLPGADDPNTFVEIGEKRASNPLQPSSKDQKLYFGEYAQGTSGEIQPICWHVVYEDYEKMLLMSEFCIDTVPLFREGKRRGNDWRSSYVRAWLNTYFLSHAFSDDERDLIIPRRSVEEKVAEMVALFSRKEIAYYFSFSDGRLKATPTPYARQKGLGAEQVPAHSYWYARNNPVTTEQKVSWWTRDCGAERTIAISATGEAQSLSNLQGTEGTYSYPSKKVGIRPVIMIRKNAACKDAYYNDFISGGKESFVPNTGIVYVYKGDICCRRLKHTIRPVTAVMHDQDGKEIQMNVEYCTKCQKFLLNYISYQEYRKRHGVLIGNLRLVTDGLFDGAYNLAEESPLKLSGYNVGQQSNFSAKTRQYILASVIYEKIMTKVDVINYLEYFIHLNSSKSSSREACQKWREDLEFVQNYKIDVQPKVAVSEIKRY